MMDKEFYDAHKNGLLNFLSVLEKEGETIPIERFVEIISLLPAWVYFWHTNSGLIYYLKPLSYFRDTLPLTAWKVRRIDRLPILPNFFTDPICFEIITTGEAVNMIAINTKAGQP